MNIYFDDNSRVYTFIHGYKTKYTPQKICYSSWNDIDISQGYIFNVSLIIRQLYVGYKKEKNTILSNIPDYLVFDDGLTFKLNVEI